MATRDSLGGIVHSYQRYDPARIPPPRPPDIDLVSPAMERWLEFWEPDELTEEELANAVMLDPEQIAGLGPSIDRMRQSLEDRRRKILERYETDTVRKRARSGFRDAARRAEPPARHREAFERAVREEQIRQLERLWYAQEDERSRFAGQLPGLVERLGEVYQIDELAAKWPFTGREKLTVEEALAVKEELETIDDLLRQLDEARKNARIGIVDLEALGKYLDGEQQEELESLRRQVRVNYERGSNLHAVARQYNDEAMFRQYKKLGPPSFAREHGEVLKTLFAIEEEMIAAVHKLYETLGSDRPVTPKEFEKVLGKFGKALKAYDSFDQTSGRDGVGTNSIFFVFDTLIRLASAGEEPANIGILRLVSGTGEGAREMAFLTPEAAATA